MHKHFPGGALRSAAAALCLALTLPAMAADAPLKRRPPASDPVALGRYLVKTNGCNDCHTAGYGLNAGAIPEAQWLTGDSLGWRGPWGVTYPTNLRLYMAQITEKEWMDRARHLQMRPPMPWFGLRDMADEDLRAIYRYVRAAGPAGQPAPAWVPPGQAVSTPVIDFPAPPPAEAKR